MDHDNRREATLDQVRVCTQVLEDKKASDLTILDVSGQSTVTDYLVVATGTSEPHLKAMRNALEVAMRKNGIDAIGTDRDTREGWLVVDAFDFMVHLFTEKQRNYYSLEALWRDARPVEVALSSSVG
ncbi:MAG: ribosome silencing factor [Opitutales bacterium]